MKTNPQRLNPDTKERMQWWHDAKLGMFIHWGCYSVLNRGEQIMMRDQMPLAEYDQLAAQFHPAPGWADEVTDQAVRMGAKYVVLTTRHHDGYCLFKTRTHSFNAVETGPGRDLVAEYVEATRRRGLRVGLYYSVINWRWHGHHDPFAHAHELPLIVEEMHTQVDELRRINLSGPGLPGWTANSARRRPGGAHPRTTVTSEGAGSRNFYDKQEPLADVHSTR